MVQNVGMNTYFEIQATSKIHERPRQVGFEILFEHPVIVGKFG